MTFKGLEFCHRNWVLHRVGSKYLTMCPPGRIVKMGDQLTLLFAFALF